MFFIIIGNDARMNYVAEQLYSLGCDVSRELNNQNPNINLVLPPPVTDDYINIIEPYFNDISIIYGGCITESFKAKVPPNIKVYDYLEWEYVIAENAKLTANGIIKEALSHNARLKENHTLVTGYGFCGKAIASALKGIGSKVSVGVRNSKLKNEIVAEGYEYIDIKSFNEISLLKYDYIFNTVPACIINKQVIDMLNASVMIFDIASKPGGVDFDYCKEKDIFAILSLGIPGREYPKEAGYLIGSACYKHCGS